ncbi:MAG: hypothetical protein JSV18_05020 [Candidatus Bathyarchaeota archaeon]|nr:MAG: hypothetical protein JSV18_05020 [Candidatus Bathyarchaeota archaeon]
MFLLLLGPLFLSMGLASASNRTERTEMPGVPMEFKFINMTEAMACIIAYNFTAGVPNMFRFENMTMMINATRNIVLNFTTDRAMRIRYLDLDIDNREPLMLRIHANATPPAGLLDPKDGVRRYLELEPNSTEPVRMRMRLHVDKANLSMEMMRSVEIQRLRWAFWNGSDWEAITSWIDEHGYLVADGLCRGNWTIREMERPPTVIAPVVPGLPPGSRAYNYTMVTPNRFKWTVRERERAVFAFRNMTMRFNSTRQFELNITAGRRVVQRFFSLDIDPGESVSLDMNIQVDPPGGVAAHTRSIGVYLEIEPNSTGPLRAELGMAIDMESLRERLGEDIDPERFRWMWWNGSGWVPINSTLDEEGVLKATTDHFSTWTIAEVEEQLEEPDEPQRGAQWYLYGAALVIVGVAAILLVVRKRS